METARVDEGREPHQEVAPGHLQPGGQVWKLNTAGTLQQVS